MTKNKLILHDFNMLLLCNVNIIYAYRVNVTRRTIPVESDTLQRYFIF